MQDNPYSAPSDVTQSPFAPTVSAPMTMSDILFSYEGRLPRSTYWLWTLAISFLGGCVMVAVMISLMLVLGEESMVPMIVGVVCYIPFAYSYLAVQAKRWHDRDKSGWWALIGFVPYIGGLWVLVECGILEGRRGPNRFGNDPLDGRR